MLKSIHLFVGFFLTMLYGVCDAQAGAPPRFANFAVLVGISTYRQPEYFPDLPGAVYDVDSVKGVLTTNFDFPNSDKNIRVLKNAEATRKNILDALIEMRQRAQKARKEGATPVVLFYFAGHGSYVSDEGGDERKLGDDDDRDETLVPYDATRDLFDTAQYDLVDDEIGEQRHELLKYSSDVTFIFDSCHSGTLTRAPGDARRRFREADPDTRIYPQRKVEVASDAGLYSAFSACADSERALETSFTPLRQGEKDKLQGAFTYYLVQAMRDAHRNTRNADIWLQVSTGLRSSVVEQNPQLEGKPNKLFLGGAVRESTPPVTYQRTGKQIVISRGLAGGAVPGGFVQFYEMTGNKILGGGSIISADPQKAYVSVDKGVTLPAAGIVKLVTPYFGSKPLQVAFPNNDAVGARLKAFYQPPYDKFVSVAKPDVVPDVSVVISNWADTGLPAPPDNKPVPTGPIYHVSTGQGAPPLFGFYVVAGPNGEITPTDEFNLRQILEDFAAQRNLQGLTNASQDSEQLRKAVQFKIKRLPPVGDNKTTPVVESPNMMLANSRETFNAKFQVDERIQFQVENQLDKTIYATLIWVSGDGGITVLRNSKDSTVMTLDPRGKDNDTALTGVYVISAPLGRETLRLFISTQSIDLSSLEREPVRRGDLPSKGVPSPFDSLIGQAMNTRSPGSKTAVNFNSWSDDTISLDITR